MIHFSCASSSSREKKVFVSISHAERNKLGLLVNPAVSVIPMYVSISALLLHASIRIPTIRCLKINARQSSLILYRSSWAMVKRTANYN